jgi:hypothetical protein
VKKIFLQTSNYGNFTSGLCTCVTILSSMVVVDWQSGGVVQYGITNFAFELSLTTLLNMNAQI